MMLNRMTNRARLTRLATPQVERNQGTWLLTHSGAAPNWPADEWERLDRYLIFGGERDANMRDVPVLRDRLEADGPRVVRRIVELISMGRVVSDGPCLTALAMCAALGRCVPEPMEFTKKDLKAISLIVFGFLVVMQIFVIGYLG